MQQIKHYQVVTADGATCVHYPDATGNGSALCGADLDGDWSARMPLDEAHHAAVATTAPVDCRLCLRVVIHVSLILDSRVHAKSKKKHPAGL